MSVDIDFGDRIRRREGVIWNEMAIGSHSKAVGRQLQILCYLFEDRRVTVVKDRNKVKRLE